jgi:hypothetical protein
MIGEPHALTVAGLNRTVPIGGAGRTHTFSEKHPLAWLDGPQVDWANPEDDFIHQLLRDDGEDLE